MSSKQKRVHELKTHRASFEAILAGNKRHEVRMNDRGFKSGELLKLREWNELLLVQAGTATTAHGRKSIVWQWRGASATLRPDCVDGQ